MAGLFDSSEEDALASMNPYDAIKFAQEYQNSRVVSPEQAAKNQTSTLWDMAYATPVVGNVLNALDAPGHYSDAYKAVRAGDTDTARKHMLAGHLSTLGALTLPSIGNTAASAAENASSRLNVFVPAAKDSASIAAKDMRNSGAENSAVWRKTGRFFNPDGTVMQEIPDAMKINRSPFVAGDTMPMRELVDHPALYERYPSIGEKPVTFTDHVDNRNNPVYRTNPDTGGFNIGSRPGAYLDQKQIAKLFQYGVSDIEGLPPAIRHAYQGVMDTLTNAKKGVSVGAVKDVQPLIAYFRMLDDAKAGLADDAAKYGSNEAVKRLSMRIAGNVDAKAVTARAGNPKASSDMFPYSSAQTNQRPGTRLGKFENMIPLARPGVSKEDFRDFLDRWYKLGSGRSQGSGE